MASNKLTLKDVEKAINGLTFISVPSDTYTTTIGDVDSPKYTVYYNGEKLNDVYGVTRYARWIDGEKWSKPITNWRKEMEDECN